jgi:hypothetical protein
MRSHLHRGRQNLKRLSKTFCDSALARLSRLLIPRRVVVGLLGLVAGIADDVDRRGGRGDRVEELNNLAESLLSKTKGKS